MMTKFFKLNGHVWEIDAHIKLFSLLNSKANMHVMALFTLAGQLRLRYH